MRLNKTERVKYKRLIGKYYKEGLFLKDARERAMVTLEGLRLRRNNAKT